LTEPLLLLDDLVVRFSGAAAPAVDGLRLELAPGETLALVGASGCGKTAAARAVAGLHPDGTRIGGRALWRDADLLTLAPSELRRRLGSEIATVFQDAGGSLNPVVRVGDQLGELLRFHRTGGVDLSGACEALMREVRLEPDLGRRYPHQLSGGEQQRVALALALAGNPALLIADEPTTALDPAVQLEIVSLLRALVRRRSMALLFITHDLELAGRVADGVAVMDRGRIVETGRLADVIARPRSGAARVLAAAYGDRSSPPAGPVDSGDAVLKVENLVVRRSRTGPPALDAVTFGLARGEAFGLVGASGSGKTTLARTLAGFLSGSGRIDPDPCGRGGVRPIQMIFQSPAAALDPRQEVLSSVAEAAAAAGSDDPAAEARTLLDEVGFPGGLERRRPHALSGGQRQRVVIARVLAARPEVIVADEPASSLDLPSRQSLVDLLDRIRSVRGIALVLISHDLRLVRRCCGRIGVLESGKLVEIVGAGMRPETAAGRGLWSDATSPPPGPVNSR